MELRNPAETVTKLSNRGSDEAPARDRTQIKMYQFPAKKFESVCMSRPCSDTNQPVGHPALLLP